MVNVSVLIPTYNREAFIEDALNSILQQESNSNSEIIVYDDGSTDATHEIIEEFQKQYEIKYIRSNENHGVGYARNRLLEAVTGDYFIWQDSDDISDRHRIKVLVDAIEECNADVVFSAMYFFKHPNLSRKNLSQIDVTKYINRDGLSNNMHFATGIFKAELKTYKFAETVKRKEDVIWLTELIRDNKGFAYVPEPLYFCRRHSGRLTPQKS